MATMSSLSGNSHETENTQAYHASHAPEFKPDVDLSIVEQKEVDPDLTLWPWLRVLGAWLLYFISW